ncbi:MAG: hypothetical protein AAGE52_02975 [Myxococcota bacterium]
MRLREHISRTTLLLALAFACTPTETGNPPIVEPAGFGVEPDFGFGEPTFRLTAPPGAITPPEGLLRITPLDEGTRVVQVPVAGDGSINVMVEGEGEHRLEVLQEERSLPLDFVIDAADPPGSFRQAERGLPCLSVEPLLALDRSTIVTVDNGCDVTVAFEARLRLGTAGIALEGPAAGTIPADDFITLDLRADSARGEDHLLLEITDPAPTRRVVTLF